jgi:MFS family permease
MNFVFFIKLFEVTGSAISTSLLWVSYALPAILIGPFAPGILDLVDKRKILVITNFLQSLTIFIYALLSGSGIFLLYGVVFVYSFLNQFYVPSEISTLPFGLKKKELGLGKSLFFITQQGSLVLGFGIAGLLTSVLGFRITLFLCSIFLFIAFVSTTFLPSNAPQKSTPKLLEDTVVGFFKHLFEGYKFIRRERYILTPVLLLLVFQILLQVCAVQIPVIARDLLSIQLNLASVFILVPAGIGAGVGALYLPKILKKGVRKKKIIDTSLLSVGVSIVLLTFVVPVLFPVLKVILSFVLIALIGFGFVGVLIPSQTFLQESTPEDFRGRVFGNFSFLVVIASVLPVIFSGSIVELFGIRPLFLALAIVILIVFRTSKKYGDEFLSG